MENDIFTQTGVDPERLHQYFFETKFLDNEIIDLVIPKESVYYIMDNVYNLVPFPKYIKMIIDTPEFQRLHYVKQLGFLHLIYPGAMHTRFSHSLGVYHLAQSFLKNFLFNGLSLLKIISNEDPKMNQYFNPHLIKLFLISALCHDIGHPPLSHVMESKYPEPHQIVGANLIGEIDNDKGLNVIQNIITEIFNSVDILKLIKIMIKENFDLEDKKTLKKHSNALKFDPCIFLQLKKILHMVLDRVDYLLRDSYNCGIKYGSFEYIRLLNNISLNFTNLNPTRFYILEKGLDSYKCLLSARLHMYKNCYYHKTVRSINGMILKAVDSKVEEESEEIFERWKHQTDELIWRDLVKDEDIFFTLRISDTEKDYENFIKIAKFHNYLIRSIFRREFYKRVLTLWKFDFKNVNPSKTEIEVINELLYENSATYKHFLEFKCDFSKEVSKKILTTAGVEEMKGYQDLFLKKNYFVLFDHPILNLTRDAYETNLNNEIKSIPSMSKDLDDFIRPYVILSDQFINLQDQSPNLSFRRNSDETLRNLELENHKSSFYFHPLRIFVINRIPIVKPDSKPTYHDFDDKFYKDVRLIWNDLLDSKHKKIKDFLPKCGNI